MIRNHPDADLLVEYSAGTMDIAPMISVTTHLQFCDSCRRAVGPLSSVGGEMLEHADGVAVSEGLLDKVLACLDEPGSPDQEPQSSADVVDDVADVLPSYLRQFLPVGNLAWRSLSPSLKVAPIGIGEKVHELALHRIKVGGKVPEHNHKGSEITVVLKGSFSDEDGVYQEGDFIVREAGDVHQPIAAKNEECICLSVLAAPIKLTGIKRLLNPLLTFSPG